MCEAAGEPPEFAVVRGRHGLFRYLPNDRYVGASLAAYGEFSELETMFLCQLCKPGATVLDIGANIGAHSIPLARHLTIEGNLHAFEPQPLIHELLVENLHANDVRNTHAHRVALGNTTAPLYLPELDYSAAGNFGGISLTADGGGMPVDQVRLDDYLDLPAMHLMKIDAEGMEIEVLQGSEALLGHFRPLLYIENDRPERSGGLIETLFSLNYRLRWSTPPLFNPDNFFGVYDDIFGGVVSVNMLCIPAERYVGDMGDAEITASDQRPW